MEFRNVVAQAAIVTQAAARKFVKRTTSSKPSRLDTLPAGSVRPNRLEVVQPANSSLLQIELTVGDSFVPSGLWVEHAGNLLRLGSLHVSDSTNFDSRPEAELSISFDMDDLVENSTAQTSLASSKDSSTDEIEGHVLRLYLEYEGFTEEQLPASQIEASHDGVRVGLVRLGRAHRTQLSNFAYRRVNDHFYYPLVNRNGHLVIEVDRKHQPYAQIRNDGLVVKDGKLQIKGRMSTRGTNYLGGEIVVLGRTSGFKTTAPIALELNGDLTAKRFGLRHYTFTASVDFNCIVSQIEDDNADLYLDLDAELADEPKRARIGKSRYLVRLGTYGSSVSSGDKTVSITPYYTFKAKNPSLGLEVFDSSTYQYMQSLVSNRRWWKRPDSARRPVWLIGELPYKAQDNGLQFFRYMRDEHPEIDAYYVIRSDSPERANLDGYDHVLDFRSRDHVQVTLAADKVIGTHHPDFLYPTREPRFEKATHAEQVFLQHGVTAAKWMVPNYGKSIKGFNVDLITVCSEREKQFFVKDFGYSPEQVAVTGFARFDALLAGDVEVAPGQLMIMPTWRPWLQDPEHFIESEYFQRWKSLLSSDRFRQLVDKYDLDPIFCLHPNMQQFSSHFAGAGIRVVSQGEIDVQFMLKQSSMLLTDYSSVAFDFAFLHKPVAYYQFDDHRFAQPHADPPKEFPGPVVADEDQVLDAIDTAFGDQGKISNMYQSRADRFLTYRDTNNRERIFEAIQGAGKLRPSARDILNDETMQSAYRIVRRQRYYFPAIKRLYKLMRWVPLDKNTIVFEAGQGKQFADSPRAIHEELIKQGDTRRKVWIYNKRLPVTDDHTTVVKRHSPAFFWYLATAKYWVNNHNFPNYIHRRKGGLFIQTWHGTPLKRMFLDQDNFYGRDPGYIDRVKEASAQWNALVSPSPYATAAMKSAYGYDGPAYELGYPRNDVLRGPHTQEARAAVRHRLSISADKTVVLYAPTFRDDQPTSRGRFAFDWPFDPSSFVERFGDDVVLLVRTHFLVNTTLPIPDSLKTNIIDVGDYPDIQDLFLASDMLVTDYSSSFFDYSVLERPIIFFAYDLENYRDNLRGFYLDYDRDLPGPTVETPEELFDSIEKASSITDADRTRLREFANLYAPNDDGHASARVIDRLLPTN